MTRPLEPDDHVVVVGAGLAGWRCCEALRREGFAGSLTLVGDEEHLPYDRPPLSKQVLAGKWESERAHLATAEQVTTDAITLRLGAPAVALRVDELSVQLATGDDVRATHVVVATGSRARELSHGAESGVVTLRSLDDAAQLVATVDALADGSTVVVIGGGFIGAEVATSLHARGHHLIVLETLVRPLISVLGETASDWLKDLPSDAGVDLRCGQDVVGVSGQAGALSVALSDGTSIDAALVVVGIGAIPNTEWLESSGLEVRNGLVVNDHLMAAPSVAAIGDVARFTWRHAPFVEELRVEHWETASNHASYLARVLVSGTEAVGPIEVLPYFWSDQYGKKIQMLGHPSPTDDVTMLLGSVTEGRWLCAYSRDSLVTGLLSLSHPRALMLSRNAVEHHEPLSSVVDSAPWSV